MSFDRLLRAKEELEKNGPVKPRMFEDEQEQVRKTLQVTGHKDKQGHCHCGYNQTCVALICERCGRERSHASVAIIERTPEGVVTQFWYRHCKCGAKQWMYPCEKRVVRRYG